MNDIIKHCFYCKKSFGNNKPTNHLRYLCDKCFSEQEAKPLGCICDGDKNIGNWVDCCCWTCKRNLSRNDLEEELLDMQKERNKMNRNIAKLKKASLKTA